MASEDFAVTCTLEELPSVVGKKIRIAAKIISYDPCTNVLLLADHLHGLLVDMSLCLDPSQSLHYLRENKGTLMVVGSLERVEFPLEIPVLSNFVEAPSLDDQMVLRAILARSVNDLKLSQWRMGIISMNEIKREARGKGRIIEQLWLIHS